LLFIKIVQAQAGNVTGFQENVARIYKKTGPAISGAGKSIGIGLLRRLFLHD